MLVGFALVFVFDQKIIRCNRHINEASHCHGKINKTDLEKHHVIFGVVNEV